VSRPFHVVAADVLPARFRELFTGQLPDPAWTVSVPDSDDPAALAALVGKADALVTRWRRVDETVLAAAGDRLQLVQVLGRHPLRVDAEAARRRGIAVATMPSGGCIAVAEQAMALMLAVARQVVPGHRLTATAAYVARGVTPVRTSETVIAFNWMGLPVTELRGRTLGLVGFGEIGQEVARRALAFDMRVLYTRRTRLAPADETMLGVEYATLDALVSSSDVVSLHVPHTGETDRLVDAALLARFKPGAVLINTARGGLVDEAALVAALTSGRLGAAGLDVFVEEPLPSGHPLAALPTVVLAPHVGGGSGGGHKGHVRDALANIARVARGEAPLNRVA
jgi:phosphoglycerate dehydrogenase-like enzyme